MFGLIKLNNIENKIKLEDKLQNYEFVGVYESLSKIEHDYKNRFAHKYRLLDNHWCYFVIKPNKWNEDIDSSKLSDMLIVDLEIEKDYILDYQTGLKCFSLKEILREIKLNMIL